MQQTKQSEATDGATLDPAISLMCDLIEAMCISEDDALIEAGRAHSAISAPLLGVNANDDDSGDLGFLVDSPSWTLGGTKVPDLPPLKTRAYEDYMGKLNLDGGAMNDHIMILYRIGDGSYHAKCLECGAVFQADNKLFHNGLCPVHQKGFRWVSVSEISLNLSGHYSSGAKVIPKSRSYTPK